MQICSTEKLSHHRPPSGVRSVSRRSAARFIFGLKPGMPSLTNVGFSTGERARGVATRCTTAVRKQSLSSRRTQLPKRWCLQARPHSHVQHGDSPRLRCNTDPDVISQERSGHLNGAATIQGLDTRPRGTKMLPQRWGLSCAAGRG